MNEGGKEMYKCEKDPLDLPYKESSSELNL